jgi:type IV pilus assembly protein PilQ
LESDGIGKIISSPRVITANNVKAKIEDGTEVPYVTTQTSGTAVTQTVSFKSAKLSLEATPQITPEGTVRMAIVVKKEEPDWTRPFLAIRRSRVRLLKPMWWSKMVERWLSVVCLSPSPKIIEKVPLLGDIPFLGWLFKYKNDTGKRRELLVFITPRVISDKMRID